MIVEERPRLWTSDRVDAAPPRTTAWDAPLSIVLRWLPVVALAELLLMRTFYRVGIHIPKEEPFRTVYTVLTAVGSFALNLSTVLTGAALAILGLRAWRTGSRRAGVALLGFVVVSVVLAGAGPGEVGPSARLVFVWALLLLVVPFLGGDGPLGVRVAVAGVAAVAALATYSGLVADAATVLPAASSPAGAVGAQLLAEALVVATAFAFAVAWIRGAGWRPGPLALALGPALALLGLWRANGAITGILVLWTAGLRLYLPVWLYVVALWAFVAAAIGWRREAPWRASGMTLLLVAGMLLGSTYVQGLFLVALALLTDGAATCGLPAARWRRRGRRSAGAA